MADNQMSAQEFLGLLEESAREFAPVEANEFSIAAQEELTTYREGLAVRVGAEARPSRGDRTRVYGIPKQYASQAELFLVYDTFVRVFIHPIVVAAEVPTLARNLIDDGRQQFAFVRFEDTSLPLWEREGLREDLKALTRVATEIGQELFGKAFSPNDFWAYE